MCVCVRERDRQTDRDRESVCERERERMCVRERMMERDSVYGEKSVHVQTRLLTVSFHRCRYTS